QRTREAGRSVSRSRLFPRAPPALLLSAAAELVRLTLLRRQRALSRRPAQRRPYEGIRRCGSGGGAGGAEADIPPFRDVGLDERRARAHAATEEVESRVQSRAGAPSRRAHSANRR